MNPVSRMPRRALALIAAGLALSVTLLAVPSDMAVYIGGTIPDAKAMTEGELSTSDPERLTFLPKSGAAIAIPYASMTSIAYGRKAARRSGWALFMTPLALLSKKRQHYLRVTYADGPAARTAEFEIGKGIVRTTLKVLEVRTGKEIETWALTTN